MILIFQLLVIGYSINGLKRFDIVVIKYQNEKIIKRVIGLPGDYVEYYDNELYINGSKVEEEFERGYTNDGSYRFTYYTEPIILDEKDFAYIFSKNNK